MQPSVTQLCSPNLTLLNPSQPCLTLPSHAFHNPVLFPLAKSCISVSNRVLLFPILLRLTQSCSMQPHLLPGFESLFQFLSPFRSILLGCPTFQVVLYTSVFCCLHLSFAQPVSVFLTFPLSYLPYLACRIPFKPILFTPT